jgi:hypothetical protein
MWGKAEYNMLSNINARGILKKIINNIAKARPFVSLVRKEITLARIPRMNTAGRTTGAQTSEISTMLLCKPGDNPLAKPSNKRSIIRNIKEIIEIAARRDIFFLRYEIM